MLTRVLQVGVCALGGVALLAGAGRRLTAQPGAGAIARIEALARSGADSAALSIADSILADTDPGNSAYGTALYWRGTLRHTPDARLDLIRLTVDFPTHPSVPSALYALAQEDLALGARDLARIRLDRIVRDFMSSEVGPQAALEAGRMHLQQNEIAAACAALDSSLAHAAEDQVELRNQAAYAARPCEQWKEALGDSTSKASSGKPGTATARGATPLTGAGGAGKPAASGRWTVQVAAFTTRPEAERLAAKLVALGYEARVALETPFRVRVGRFQGKAAAAELVNQLRRQQFTAIVVESERQ
ncbi:MAG: SPOR domain-containing protein [Gemmatimonadaceae bacterium]|nr:SPOR domain-containing protein [Gemmatimonadaceae bacterium]